MRVLMLMAAFLLTSGMTVTFACECAPLPVVTGPRDFAESQANRADAVFEGKVRGVALHWKLRDTPAGDLLLANLDDNPPTMLVTFEVSRSYRGTQPDEVQIETGLGAGDCGFDFEAGRQYLVYADADENGHLSTSVCSGTALLEDSAANLAYLRGEANIPEPARRSKTDGTGKVCGRVVYEGLNPADDRLFFFREGRTSLVPNDEAEISNDGHFCADSLTPAKYRLMFVHVKNDLPILAAFFPGVVQPSRASLVTVRPGQEVSSLIFRMPTLQTCSVQGVVNTSDGSQLPAGLKVVLMGTQSVWPVIGGAQDVASDGSFSFPQILPGKYWAVADASSVDSSLNESKWLTRKVEIEVRQNVTGLALQLIPNKIP